MKQGEIDIYVKDIEKSLIERYGELRPAIRPLVEMYGDALERYNDMMVAYREGNHTGVLIKSIKDTIAIIVALSAKLGVASPLDLAKLKKAESYKEEKENEMDYLDSLTD